MHELEFRSRLAAPAAEVWALATTPEGINGELMPLLRMTVPKGAMLDLTAIETPARLGRSWLLLGGVVPIDYDDLLIEAVGPGMSFRERSTMLTMRDWHHDRTVTSLDANICEVHDRVAFEPRLPVGRLLVSLVRFVFTHRHRRLGRRWGRA